MKKAVYLFCLVCLFWLPVIASAEEEGEVEWTDVISVYGYIDGRINFHMLSPEAEGIDSTTDSDMYMRYVSLGALFQPNKFITGDLLFTMENEEDFYVERGTITVQYPSVVTPYITLGILTLPTGGFETYAIEYSTAQTLFEASDTAIGMGITHPFFDLNCWFFNGDNENVDENGEADDNVIDTFLAHAELYPLALVDGYNMTLGGFYLSDATESDYDFVASLFQGNYEQNVPAYGGYLNADFQFSEMFGVGVIGEYATTAMFDKQNYLDGAGDETVISAINTELALLLMDQTIQVGGKYEQANGIDWLGMQANDPDYEIITYSRFGGFVGFDPWPFLHLGARYMAGNDNEGNADSEFMFQSALGF